MSSWRAIFLACLAAIGLAVGVGVRQLEETKATRNERQLVLLVPDGTPPTAFFIQIWQDAANDQGVKLDSMEISAWVRQSSYAQSPGAGVIVPDTHHRRLGQTAISALTNYVRAGGNLMLVQDAGLLDEAGHYAEGPSRLSHLAGVQYGNYDRRGKDIGGFLRVQGKVKVLESLLIPPGRYQPLKRDGSLNAMPAPEDWLPDGSAQVSGYGNAQSRFPILRTEQSKTPPMLFSPEGDVVAIRHAYGKGSTLFVNLPLTHLRQQTDGIFLNGFVGLFAQGILGMPALLPTPGNRGVFVLNWHNDDRLAIHYLQKLQAEGIFDHGHQSLHFTAGPDVNQLKDGKGMDLANNAEALDMIKLLTSQGHTIGNHGGWIHNLFGIKANDRNANEFEPYLDLNNEAVKAANGDRQPIEYSAPMGNNPAWVYDWLDRHDNQAFYSTGDIGMAPTKQWMGQRRMGGGWAFPVMTNGNTASAEEAYFNHTPQASFSAWLQQVARFVEEQRVMRLSYFHPVGAALYIQPVKDFVDRGQRCTEEKRCQFMSMTEAAAFLTRREQVRWQIQVDSDGLQTLTANHSTSLSNMVWKFPRSHYQAVHIEAGNAAVDSDARAFYVAVRDGRNLKLSLKTNATH